MPFSMILHKLMKGALLSSRKNGGKYRVMLWMERHYCSSVVARAEMSLDKAIQSVGTRQWPGVHRRSRLRSTEQCSKRHRRTTHSRSPPQSQARREPIMHHTSWSKTRCTVQRDIFPDHATSPVALSRKRGSAVIATPFPYCRVQLIRCHCRLLDNGKPCTSSSKLLPAVKDRILLTSVANWKCT